MDDLPADEVRSDRTDSDLDRCDALLDVAQDHVRNNRPEPAIAIWRRLMDEGGEAGDDARLELADYLVEQAHDAEQWALQAALGRERISRLTWLRAAALLERRGKLVDALIWYSRATVHLTAEQVNNSGWAKLMVTGRRRVKWALGMELDDIDLLGDAGDVEGTDKYFNLLDLLREPVIIRGRVEVWSRAEFAAARQHWPGRITMDSVDAYYRGVEGVLRRYDEHVTVMHRTFDFFLDCIDGLDQRLAKARMSEPPQGETPGVPWPPERNQPCWCDSGKKYEKCCGMGQPPFGPQQAWGPAGLRSGGATRCL
jgi:hypothetical protein